MEADLKGALEQLDRSWKAFEHKGKPMTKLQVRAVLVYGIHKGYKSTGQLTDDEVDTVLRAAGKKNKISLAEPTNEAQSEACTNTVVSGSATGKTLFEGLMDADLGRCD